MVAFRLEERSIWYAFGKRFDHTPYTFHQIFPLLRHNSSDQKSLPYIFSVIIVPVSHADSVGDNENVSCQYCEASVVSMPILEVNF